MGLFSSSKRTTSNTSHNYNTSFGVGGDNNGIAISGDGNVINSTDFGAIEGAFETVGDVVYEVIEGQKVAVLSNENIVNSSLMSNENIVNSSLMSNENIVTTSLNNNKDIVDQVLLGNTDTQLAIAGLASEFGGNVTYLADGSIQGNQALTELSLNNNAILTSEFGDKMLAMSDKNADLALASMDNSAALSSQFGADMSAAFSGYSNNLADLAETSINRNTELSNEFGNKMVDVVSDSQMALTEMAVLQERGLENALEVAGNMSMDDSAESSAEMIKYLSIGLAVVGAAMVFKS